MSVKVHEAYCLDSAQDRLLFYEDFLGDSVRDLWAVAGTGSAVVVDAQDGGVVRITTGATSADNYRVDWGAIRSLLVSKKVTVEARVKLNSITSVSFNVGMFGAGTTLAYFLNSGTTLQMRIGETGVTTTNTATTIDTDYHIYRIECFPAGEIHFYYDGVECANSPLTVAANIPTGYMQPFLYLRTDAAGAKSMDVDYVVIRQEI